MAEKVQIVEALPRLPTRRPDAHKGDFGRVLIIGGSRGMVGAVALAARAALRSGAGLVTMAVPACIQQTVAALCPPATSIALPDTTDGTISATAPELFADDEEFALPYDVVAIGPGLGRTESSDRAVELFVELFGEVALLPVVIDADALNALAESDRLAGTHNFRTIITPHPGELARRLCPRAVAVGADGLLIVDGAAAQVWNADGSRAAFCGNAARCLGRRLLESGAAEPVSLQVGDHHQ